MSTEVSRLFTEKQIKKLRQGFLKLATPTFVNGNKSWVKKHKILNQIQTEGIR
jgi:hypothetical protein